MSPTSSTSCGLALTSGPLGRVTVISSGKCGVTRNKAIYSVGHDAQSQLSLCPDIRATSGAHVWLLPSPEMPPLLTLDGEGRPLFSSPLILPDRPEPWASASGRAPGLSS